MTVFKFVASAVALAVFFPGTPRAQPLPAPPNYTYADLADLAISAPVAIDARIRSAIALKGNGAAGTPPGFVRMYVEADVLSLIRGAGGSPALVNYVAELPLDSRGRPPKLKKARVLLLARPVSGRPGVLQLVAPDAQIAWSAEADAQIRAILAAATASNAPPQITGIGNAFHVPGAVAGESETQIFLQTADGRPVSLSVIRRPGQVPQWAVALGEIVDEAAATPQTNSLLWYRLACALPRQLPPQSAQTDDPRSTQAARADYRVVIDGLGPCPRNRAPTPQSSSLPR